MDSRAYRKELNKGEIVITEADKGKMFTVSSKENYIAQGTEHTSKDKEINHNEVKIRQTKLSNTGKAISLIFNVGQNHGEMNRRRCHENAMSENCTVPLLKVYPKVHKPVQADGIPKSRAVVGASDAMSTRAS